MSIWKKIVILLIVILTISVLILLYRQRNDINRIYESMETGEEVYTGESDDISSAQHSEFKSIEKTNILSVSSFVPPKKLELSDCCIKASCNTAFTGSYMNLDMIEHVLLRGCRFLDFEIYSINGHAYVGYSSDNSIINIDSKNKIPVNDVFKEINNKSFQAPISNSEDPLFIHLRIKTNNNELYKIIAQAINANFSNRLYSGTVNASTKIDDLRGQYVIIVDKSAAPDFDKYPVCETEDEPCMNLKNFVSLVSGGDALRTYRYMNVINQQTSPVHVNDDGITTDSRVLKMVLPDIGPNFYGIMNNPNVNTLVKDYGVQIVCYNFYNNDTELEKYEEMFGEFKNGIVPLAKAILYLESHDE